jgi:phosphodiesterase/alkaline phosphatase D-like protein
VEATQAAAVAAIAALLLLAAPAGAAEFHPYEFSFDGTGSTAGQFGDLEVVAVEQSAGTVYAFDRSKVVIDKFDAAGNPQNFSSTGTSSLNVATACPGFSMYQYGEEDLAVDSSGTENQGNIYLASYGGGGVCAFNAAGEFLYRMSPEEDPKLGGACGVTTDSLGRLWVGSFGNGAMRYTATGSPPTLVAIAGLSSACKFAVGNQGKLYMADAYGRGVERWTVVGFEKRLTENGNYVEFDPGTEHIFVSAGNRIDEYTTEGEHLSETGTGPPFDQTGIGTISGASAVHVRSSTGDIYVADRGAGRVKVYGALGTFPDVTTGGASNIKRTVASVSGEVVPKGGNVVDCHVDWGTSSAYGNTTSCEQATPFSNATPVSADLSGLSPGTEYHYRVVAENAVGANYGADQAFSTPYVDGVTTGAASAITRTAATLNGSLEPNGNDAHYYFEWGTDTGYGNSTPVPPGTDAGSGAGSVPASAPVSGLAYKTTYHYRLVASNAEGTTYGEDKSFSTLDAVIGLETTAATGVTQSDATLNGKLDPDGMSTTYYFEWGPTDSYGNTTAAPPGLDAGSAAGSKSVSAQITGLDSYQNYHYRLVGVNSLGTTYGEDETLTTLPPMLPSISGTAADEITDETAMISAQINPGFGETVYRVQYGRDTTYASRTNTGAALEPDNSSHPVSIELEGLNPGTTYHYRVVAINFTGVSHGPDQTFTTQRAPRIVSNGAGSVTESSARIDVTINPGLAATTYHVDYGKTGRFTSSTPESSVIGPDSADHAASTTISGLTPGTGYQFRVVATNVVGTTSSEVVKFTTNTPAPPTTGEPPTTRCRKGFVRKGGRCVRKHRRKKGRHRHRRRHSGSKRARG